MTAQPCTAGGDSRRTGKYVPAGGHSKHVDAQTPRVSGSATDPKSVPYLRSLFSDALKQRLGHLDSGGSSADGHRMSHRSSTSLGEAENTVSSFGFGETRV